MLLHMTSDSHVALIPVSFGNGWKRENRELMRQKRMERGREIQSCVMQKGISTHIPPTLHPPVNITLYNGKNETCFPSSNCAIQAQLEPYVNVSSIGRYVYMGRVRGRK